MASLKFSVLVAAMGATSVMAATPNHISPKATASKTAATSAAPAPQMGSVTGQAFIQTSGGAPRTCAGQDEVLLLVEERNTTPVQSMFGSTNKGFAVDVAYPDSESKGDKKATCDATGAFRFSGVEPGSYFVVSHIAWAGGKFGGSIMKRVEVTPGETADIILSASVDDTPPPPEPPKRDPREVVAEQAVRARLIDPSSAEFQWPGRWIENADYKAWIWSKPIHGDYTCGKVNARNRMGGYVGQTSFLVVVADGAVVNIDMDSAGTSGISISGMRCEKLGF